MKYNQRFDIVLGKFMDSVYKWNLKFKRTKLICGEIAYTVFIGFVFGSEYMMKGTFEKPTKK